jgi:hypothetical protein
VLAKQLNCAVSATLYRVGKARAGLLQELAQARADEVAFAPVLRQAVMGQRRVAADRGMQARAESAVNLRGAGGWSGLGSNQIVSIGSVRALPIA